ncbi:MAG: tRNA (guanosine(37)-N1)-methyltransferase TrmD [Actinomycetaceae bacterium]|nr:tRNA (guanosine(37)-N1)-methyltransferase TrmD [Actinomycetaceae bacterium]
MRFDVITIFPEFFSATTLSLLGKAVANGVLDIRAHNLRHWASGTHLSVDDSPAGGGAGMVMRSDVWGKALDAVLGQNWEADGRDTENAASGRSARPEGVVLAVPTPSGTPFTQRHAEYLATKERIVLAPGRYEGIDARVVEHYRSRCEVFEFSLGDYVLNGGEVACVALIEAVGRLIEGVVGNPQSLVEESHSSAGLLEYPVYTKPRSWRGLDIPAVLQSGDHAKVARWRQARALEKTAARRPDMIGALDPAQLDKHARAVLAENGFAHVRGWGRVTFGVPTAASVAALAAQTFPDACPHHMSSETIAEFIQTELSEQNFQAALADPAQIVYGAYFEDELVAYTWTVLPGADQPNPDADMAAKTPLGTAYLSKCYAHRKVRSSGISGALLEKTVRLLDNASYPVPAIALATNTENKRARKFYRHHGFRNGGRRTFVIGDTKNYDTWMVRELTDVKVRQM